MNTPRTMLLGLLFVAATTVFAQEQTSTAPRETTTAAAKATTAGAEEPVTYASSEDTRAAFLQVLNRYPPQVSKVLKLDPSLFSNASYLASYPALSEFVAQHPEVAHAPAFFLEPIYITGDLPPRTASERMWAETREGIAVLVTMLLVAGTLAWLIRTLIEHRRWSRLARTQVEMHGKLMDRLQSNEELLAYMQTAAGKRFLESAPIPVDSSPRAVSAPIGRILWSVQVGLIVAMGGIGLQIVSRTVDKSASQPLVAMGVLAAAIGFGFLLSAVVSYVMSKRLGLIGGSEPKPGE